MSIWPFSNRRSARAPQPAPSPGQQGQTTTSTPPADNGVVARRLSKRKYQRRRKSPSVKPLTPLDESVAKEPKESSIPPLEPIKPTSPMDTTFAERRPSTGGSFGAEDITALPNSRALRTSPHLRPVTQDTADIPYNWNLRTSSHHSLPADQPIGKQQRGKLQRNTSRNKRAAYDSPLARRRSTKKRKDDHLREEEIRAMSMPMQIPKRGAAGDTGLLRRESKKHRGSLNRNLERPVSTISLPLEDSIHSSMSGASDPRKYRLSVLNMISPRPTIRFQDSTRTFTNNTESSNLIRKASNRIEQQQRKTLHKRQPSKEKEHDRARIDSLADELDSTELRDILDRDQRRREKKRDRDAERLKRKLERRAEKQRTKEWLAAGGGDDARSDHNTIVPDSGAEDKGKDKSLGEVKDEDTHMAEEPTFHMEDLETEDPFADAQETKEPELEKPVQTEQTEEIPRMPLLGSHDDEYERDVATPSSEIESPTEETAQAVTYTTSPPITPITSAIYHGDRRKASKLLGADVSMGGFTRSANALQDVPSPKDAAAQQRLAPRKEDALRRDTEPLEVKKSGGMFASLFRRNRRSSVIDPKNAPSPEPSFSNTSREEMSRNIPAHLIAPALVTSAPRSAAAPLRTTSKFREDLPESPLSPLDSSVQSPGGRGSASGLKLITSRRNYKAPSTINTDASSGHRVGSPDAEAGARRPDSPLSGRASGIMSHSLASVDSEASWLSGGKPRGMIAQSKKHSSIGGGSLTRPDDFNGSYEELEVPDDEYFRRLNTPQTGQKLSSGLSVAMANPHVASSTAMASAYSETDEPGSSPPRATQEGHLISHAGASRQPMLIHREQRVKSSEGLLKQYLEKDDTTDKAEDDDKTPEAEYPTPADTPTPIDEEMTPVQRATSVNLGSRGHARNMSAGSAKLLDIKGRSGSVSSGPSTPKTSKFSLPLSKEGSSPLQD